MLFRRNQTFYWCLAVALATVYSLEAEQKSFKKEGKKFSQEERKKSLDFAKTTLADDLMPPDLKGQSFHVKEAKYQLINETGLPTNEYFQDDRLLRYRAYQPDEETLKRSDQVIEDFKLGVIEQKIESGDYVYEKCLYEDAPFELEVRNILNVLMKHVPEVKRICKVCKGHQSKKSYTWKSDAEKYANKKQQKLASDPSIKSHHIKISGGGIFSDYTVRSQWTHHDEVVFCDSYSAEEKILNNERWESEDVWTVDNRENEQMANSPNCTYVSTEWLDQNEIRNIEGQNISRPCWEKVHKYKCRHEHQKCPFFGSILCEQVGKQCKQKFKNECALWEITFKCRTLTKQKQIILDQHGIENDTDDSSEISYSPNTSFSEVVTKLKVFDEIKKELENSSYADVTRIPIFSGKKSQCSKSVQEELLYDCCFSFHGLANELKLSKCTTEELTLAEMKEKGLCHYIGSYDEKFLNFWTSRKEHVFCCFPSKLGRVLQENARDQLALAWGTAEKPDCRGLTQEELQKVDFAKLDLSEVYEASPSIDMTTKITALEERLKKQIEDLGTKK